MRRIKFLSLVCPCAFLLTASASILSAQVAPGGGGSPGQSTPSTFPTEGRTANRPSVNDPNNPADQTAPPTSKADDKKFLKEAAEGGLVEVQLGKIAADKASNPQVKEFAEQMVADHTKANDKLKEVASQDNMTVPTALDAKHQSRIEKLSKLSGDKFDKAYVKDQLKDHEMDVKEFQNEAQNGNDPKLKSFASQTLPVLQQHLEHVKTLESTGKASSKASKGM